MKTFENMAAQGDMMIIRVDTVHGGNKVALTEIPENFQEQTPEGRTHIVAHSETGHHHVIEREDTSYFTDPDDAFNALLKVEKPTPLVHERSFDTHEPVLLNPGLYKIRRQREYSPEGYRRVED